MAQVDENLKNYYTGNLAQHGFNAQGVGWKSEEAQMNRFAQLAKVLPVEGTFSVNDLGCGSGAFFTYLKEQKNYPEFKYAGYDVLKEMTDHAAVRYASFPEASFHHIQSSGEMKPADFTVASGIFNLKYEQSGEKWLIYILNTIQEMSAISSKGVSFNILTSYSDKEYMEDHLYYADPLLIFDFCKKNISKNVALLHDYYEYDFTILIRK